MWSFVDFLGTAQYHIRTPHLVHTEYLVVPPRLCISNPCPSSPQEQRQPIPRETTSLNTINNFSSDKYLRVAISAISAHGIEQQLSTHNHGSTRGDLHTIHDPIQHTRREAIYALQYNSPAPPSHLRRAKTVFRIRHPPQHPHLPHPRPDPRAPPLEIVVQIDHLVARANGIAARRPREIPARHRRRA